MNLKLHVTSMFFAINMLSSGLQADPFTELYALVKTVIKENPRKTQAVAAAILTTFIIRQYYKHKTKPKADTMTAEARVRRWEEIKNEKNFTTKVKLLLSYVDDFYIFGTRTKIVTKKMTSFLPDGTRVMVEDKEVVKGNGPITFIYDNILDGFEDFGKFSSLFWAAVTGLYVMASNTEITK